MNYPITKVYADTSVYGGVFDDEFAYFSHLFFRNVRNRYFELVISDVVRSELIFAPESVRDFANEFLSISELLAVSPAAIALQEAYIKARIVTKKSAVDAFHVALATTGQCGIILSWNCKHIVHFQKVPLYNAINVALGYAPLKILTPMEVAHAGEK